MSRRHRRVYVVRRPSGYPIDVYAATPSGEKAAAARMLELGESWERLGIAGDGLPDVALYELVQLHKHATRNP